MEDFLLSGLRDHVVEKILVNAFALEFVTFGEMEV